MHIPKNVFTAIIVAISIIMFACDISVTTLPNNDYEVDTLELADKISPTQALSIITPVFAEATFKNSDFRSTVINTALELKNGSTEIMYSTIAGKKINVGTANKTINEYLYQMYLESSHSVVSFNDTIASIPRFSILYIQPEPESLISEVLHVAHMDYTVSEFELETVTAYDEMGYTVEIDAKAENATIPILVLGMSELPDIKDGPRPFLPLGLGGNYVKWKELKIDNIYDVEGWLRHPADIYLTILYDNGGTSQYLIHRFYQYRRPDSGTWVSVNSNLFNWNTSTYGTVIGGILVEWDAYWENGDDLHWVLDPFDYNSSSLSYPDPQFDTGDEDGGIWLAYSTDDNDSEYSGSYGMRVKLGH